MYSTIGIPKALKKADIVLMYMLLQAPPAHILMVFPIKENKKFSIKDEDFPYPYY